MNTKTAQYLPNEVTDVIFADTEAREKTGWEKKVEALLESMNEQQDANVMVYRQRGTSLNDGLIFLDSWPADKFPMETIYKNLRDRYGSGDYRLQVRVDGKLRANELICIEAPKTEQKHTTELANVLETVMNRQERMMEQILLLAQQRQQDTGQDRKAFLEEMLIMKQLFDNGGGGGMTDILKGIKSLKDIGVPISFGNEAEEKEDGFMGFLGKMAPTIETIAKNAMQRPQLPPTQKPTQPAQPTETKQEKALEQEMTKVQQAIQMGISFVLTGAQKDAPVEMYSDAVLDMIPDEHLPELLQILESENWFDQLSQLSYSKTEPYRPWFELLRADIISQFEDNESANEEDTGRDTGDESNT